MLWQVAAGNVVMIAFLWFVAGDTQRWIEMSAWSRAQWMTLLVVGGGGLYFGTLYVLGMRLHEVRVRPAGPQPPTAQS
jgi:putative peptidoglycan lipid II flippase